MSFKNSIAGFLFLLMGFQVSNSLFTVAFYELEKSFILKELCVQKSLSADENTCQGQCFLKKQLREAENKSDNLPNNVKEFKLLMFQEAQGLFEFLSIASEKHNPLFLYFQRSYSKALSDIFHPPQ